VQRAAIVGRDDGDGRHSELARCPEDAYGDLAAVGYEQLVNRRTVIGASLSFLA
jgi:hypothetical protein